MDLITVTALITVTRMVAEMAANWNNPNYIPPDPKILEEFADKIEALPDLPTLPEANQ